jgi:hypothetical protein
MKKWLVIAHCMNMDGQAASHHVSDKLPYLKKRGIQPILLSAPSGKKDANYEHHQIFSFAPSGLKFESRHYLRNKNLPRWMIESMVAFFSLILLPLYLLEKLFIPLDSQWSWFASCYLKGRKLLRSQKIERIYVLGGASSGFLAACLLEKSYGTPLISECFDPLVSSNWKRNRLSYKWNLWIERKICKYSSAVFWYTNGARNEALKRNPNLAGRGFVVRPGMSPPDFKDATHKHGAKLRFCYFGGLSEERSLSLFLSPLLQFLKSNHDLVGKIEVHAYGGTPDGLTRRVMERLPEGTVQPHGRLEYDPHLRKSGRQQVLEEMRKADFLLLIHGQGDICKLYIPSKSYEYIWSQRPIVLLTPCPEEWTEVLNSNEHLISNQDNPKEIESAIEGAVQEWKSGKIEDRTQTQSFSAEDAVETIVALAVQSPRTPR